MYAISHTKDTCVLISILMLFAAYLRCECSETDVITFEDLLPDIDRFSHHGISTYSQLEFDVERYQVIVGARDHLFRLNLKDFTQLEKTEWKPSPDVSKLCGYKGQSESNCHNYIKVIHRQENRIFVCGTHAFLPQYSWRNIENLGEVIGEGNGVGKCPYSPYSDVTSVMLSDGRLYTGTTMDFSSHESAIVRMLGDAKTLRTKQYNSKWLSEPKFVGSYEMEDFIYFYFAESAVEYMNCGKIRYSRVARVCKNDAGGKHMLRENWTTFRKARLNCSRPGEYPFYYNEIQSIFYVPQEEIIYATFTTPANSIAGSAICVFNMTAIENVFSGPFKYQASSSSAWERYGPQETTTGCSANVEGDSLFSEKYQLMDDAIQPRSVEPLYTRDLERFTILAVDVVPTKLHEAVHVLFVATDDGYIKKFSILPRTKEACLLETLQPFPANQTSTIHTLKVLRETRSLYIGTEVNVLRIPVERCKQFKTKLSCINAMDPYCGWNGDMAECMVAPNENPLNPNWHQRVTQCPIKSEPVDGGWSRWSSWFSCSLHNQWKYRLYPKGESGGSCSCRERNCDHPKPSNGGNYCEGSSIEVTNCTQHGGWTEWSSWSACSSTCGGAVKFRRRSCTNPEPKFGGHVCVGPEKEESVCLPMVPCPVVVHGGWSEWTPWEACSAKCGGGLTKRRRYCNNPTPQDGGHHCSGCNIEHGTCNENLCQDHHKLTPWTPWMAENTTGEVTYERRYRFSCGAPVRSNDITVDRMKSEVRICISGQGCSPHNDSDMMNWSEWSPWSDCTVSCGGGYQFRERSCLDDAHKCQGKDREERVCGTAVCPDTGYWGSWSNWDSCSATCGHGVKRRYRKCISEGYGYQSYCYGDAEQVESCHLVACNVSKKGWNEWTDWSSCENHRKTFRQRKCLVPNPGPDTCLGPSLDTKSCDLDNSIEPLSVMTLQQAQAPGQVYGVGAGFFILGVIVGFFIAWLVSKKRSGTHLEGSRLFEPVKPNEYTSVPTNRNFMTKMSTLPRPGTVKSINEMERITTATVKRTHSASKPFKHRLDDDMFK